MTAFGASPPEGTKAGPSGGWRIEGRLLLALLLGVTLRLLSPGLHAELWYDEVYVVDLALRPFGEMLHLFWRGGDTNPPLYTLLLRLWLELGASDRHLRHLSVALGSLAIAVIYRLGAALGDRRVGGLAAVFLAVSGWGIHYSLEVRPYALFLLLGLLSTLAFVSAWDETGGARSGGGRSGPSRWASYAAWTTVAVYTHWFGLLLSPAHAAGLFVSRGRAGREPDKFRRFTLASAAIALACLPLLPLAWNQVRLQAEVGGFAWAARPSPSSLLGLASALGSGSGGLLVAALAMGLALQRRRSPSVPLVAPRLPAIAFLVTCLAVPVALALLASGFSPRFSFLVDRYFLPFAAHGLVLVAVCLLRLPRAQAAILFVAFAVFTGLDSRVWAGKRLPPTFVPLNKLTCVPGGPSELRFHLTPLTYLPTRRYRPAGCALEDRLWWDPAVGPGYVLDYVLKGELLHPRDVSSYPEALRSVPAFWVVSDPAQGSRGREGLLLARLRADPSFVRATSREVGAVQVESFEARSGRFRAAAEQENR